MARRGRFGTRPKASGNLTGLINSLYKEQRAAEDRVMFDAYQNGGLVHGKPVTDQRIRAYIAARRDGFSADDPLHDEWNNRLIQIDFKIGEEKITLAFQQGHVGAGAVANYYRSQLSKIPKDSAFYRDVASRAAQWAKSAAGSARGAASARLTKALSAKQDAVQKIWNNYSAIEAIVTQAAQRAGLIAGNQTLTDADATALQALFAAGITGPTGHAITFNDWQQASVAAYGGFDTLIGINKQLNRGTKQLTDQKGKFLDQTLIRINTIDDRAKYEAARQQWLDAVNSAQGDPKAILEASSKYAQQLSAIQGIAAKGTGLTGNDPEFIGALQNEINAVTMGKSTGATVFDLQSTTGEGVVTTDSQATANDITKALADAKAIDSGAAFYGQAKFGGPLGVIYYPPGGALDPFGRKGLGPDHQVSLQTVNDKPQEVVLVGQAVKAEGLVGPGGVPVTSVQEPNGFNGKLEDVPIQNLTPAQIQELLRNGYTVKEGDSTLGYVFTTQNGKVTYGVYDPNTGELTFTDTNPFQGAFGPSNGGFAVFGSTMANPNGTGVVASPPIINPALLASGSNLIVDATVLPSDLRAAANNPNVSAQQAADFLKLADARTKATADNHILSAGEQNVQNRRHDVGTAPPGLLSTIGAGINDYIRNAIGVTAAAKPPSLSPPKLNPPSPPSMGAPGAFRPPPTAPPPKPPPGAPPIDPIGDMLNRNKGKPLQPPPPPPPPTPPSQGGAPGAYRPPPPPPDPGPGHGK